MIDASVSLAWCLRDEQSEYADALLARLASETALVPAIWALEVANGLLIAERRGRLTAAETAEARVQLATLPIILDEAGFDTAFGAVLQLGRMHGLTAYEAAYLHLASREGVELATADTDLRAAAHASGVPLVE